MRARPPFCAICTDYIVRPLDAAPDWSPRREPLGRDGALVCVCETCATQVVPERDHLFGGGGGIGDGNNRMGAQGGPMRLRGRL